MSAGSPLFTPGYGAPRYAFHPLPHPLLAMGPLSSPFPPAVVHPWLWCPWLWPPPSPPPFAMGPLSSPFPPAVVHPWLWGSPPLPSPQLEYSCSYFAFHPLAKFPPTMMFPLPPPPPLPCPPLPSPGYNPPEAYL